MNCTRVAYPPISHPLRPSSKLDAPPCARVLTPKSPLNPEPKKAKPQGLALKCQPTLWISASPAQYFQLLTSAPAGAVACMCFTSTGMIRSGAVSPLIRDVVPDGPPQKQCGCPGAY